MLLIRGSRAAVLGVVVAGCGGGEPPAIGFTANTPPPNVATVVTAMMARESAQVDPLRLISDLPSAEGGALHGEVARALALTADPSVIAVVGPGGSREALQVAPIYREAEIPNVVPTATSRRLATVGPWTFVLAPDDSVQGQFLGTFAAERFQARDALLFYIPDEYGLGLADGAVAALAERGVRLLDRIPVDGGPTCAPDDAYQLAVDAALRRDRPDVVILATRTLATTCLARAVHARLPGTRFLVGDGTLVDAAFIARVGVAAESMYVVGFWDRGLPDPASRAFVAEFSRIVGRPPRHDDAMFYDAVMVVVEAIRTVGPDREAVRDFLADLGRGRPPFPGVTGPVAFGAAVPRPLLMTRIRQGEIQVVPAP